MATTTNDTYTLTTLLSSSSFSLAYSLPLLFISILLTFSGTFFTLDRTRQFAPKDAVLPGAFDSSKRKTRFLLEGGVGGLAIGYAFGVHLSTFLALFIPSTSSTGTLSSGSFLAIWILSSLVTTPLAGRWKYCALAFAALSGGALFALSVSVIIHPSLLTRVVFVSICMPVLAICSILPLARFQHAFLRLATASLGAFGLVLSIAVLGKIPSWENVWERLWLASNIEWGTSQEKGLDAGFCLFLAFGMFSDFLLHRKFGECPDEKWDSYLADYAANLPNLADRAGTFKPFTSAWDRFWHHSEKAQPDILFPDDKQDLVSSPMKLHKHQSHEFQPDSTPAFLKKARSTKTQEARFQARMGRKNRSAVKFRPLGELSSDSEEEVDLKPQRPWLKQKSSMSSTTPTLVEGELDYDSDKDAIVKKLGGNVPDYSDYEEDIGSPKKSRHSDSKLPEFIQRGLSPSNFDSKVPLGAVPYTPSLIKALDRVALAQKSAFDRAAPPTEPEGFPKQESSESWDAFWKDVQEKNKEKES